VGFGSATKEYALVQLPNRNESSCRKTDLDGAWIKRKLVPLEGSPYFTDANAVGSNEDWRLWNKDGSIVSIKADSYYESEPKSKVQSRDLTKGRQLNVEC
jgi:hypothetical protein